jgi:vacuolar-type H+-ATPase catalytic subunit A/Vma1
VNRARPDTKPVTELGVPVVGDPATGVPASTATVTTCSTVSMPLVARTVKVSVVLAVAARRWAAVGV